MHRAPQVVNDGQLALHCTADFAGRQCPPGKLSRKRLSVGQPLALIQT